MVTEKRYDIGRFEAERRERVQRAADEVDAGKPILGACVRHDVPRRSVERELKRRRTKEAGGKP